MKKTILIALSLLLMIALGSEFSYAQQRSSSKSTQSSKSNKVTVVKSPKTKVVTKLPTQSVTLRYNGVSVYRNGSKYYKKVGTKYQLVAPPFGLRVSIIPAIHTVFRFNSINYYCAEGVIYKETSDDQFEVVQPEIGMIVPELPEVNVSEVNVDGTIYFEFEGVLYKQIPTESGIQYKVSGILDI